MTGPAIVSNISSDPLFPIDGMTKLIMKVLYPYLGAVFLETFFYGIYCILFGICIYVLLRRNKALHWVLLVFAVLMFSLASADIGYTYYLVFGKLLEGTLSFKSLYPKYVMFVTNGILADTLLMYRCFIVWGRKKRVIAGPLLLLVATAVSGYLFEGAAANLFRHAWVYLAMTFVLNVILTILTAGRIWWLKQRTRVALGDNLLKRYSATLTILIESGVLYSTYMILDLAFQNDPSASTILDAGLIQVVGIMPTLIIVQVGLGRAINDMETTSSNEPLSRIEANKAAGISFRSFTEPNSFMYSEQNYSGGYVAQRSSSVFQADPCPGSTGEITAPSPPFRSQSTRQRERSQPPALKTHRSARSDTTTAKSFRDDEDTGSFTPAPQRRSRKRSTRSRTVSNASSHQPRSPTPAFGYEFPNKSLSKRTLYETGLDGYTVPCVVRSPVPYSTLHSAPPGIVPPISPTSLEAPRLARPEPVSRGQSFRLEEIRGDGRWGSRGHERSDSFPLSLVPSRASSDDSKGPYTPI